MKGAQTVADVLFQMILDNLHITYTLDDSTKRRLSNEIKDGIAFLKKYCDPDPDYYPGGEFAELLCEYVFRAESGALETFREDFSQEIRSAKIASDVDAFAEAMGYVAGKKQLYDL